MSFESCLRSSLIIFAAKTSRMAVFAGLSILIIPPLLGCKSINWLGNSEVDASAMQHGSSNATFAPSSLADATLCLDVKDAVANLGESGISNSRQIRVLQPSPLEIPYSMQKPPDQPIADEAYRWDIDIDNDGQPESVIEIRRLAGLERKALYKVSALYIYFWGHPFQRSGNPEDLTFFLYRQGESTKSAKFEDYLILSGFPRSLNEYYEPVYPQGRTVGAPLTATLSSYLINGKRIQGYVATDVEIVAISGRRYIWLSTNDARRLSASFLLQYVPTRDLKLICYLSNP